MKKFPLPIILAVSIVAVAVCGFALSSGAQGSYFPDSYIKGLLVKAGDGSLFAPETPEPSIEPVFVPETTPTPSPSPSPTPTVTPTPTVEPPAVSDEPPEPSAPVVPKPPEISPPVVPVTQSFTTVDRSYFDDAVFVGDSRMVGMEEYSGLHNATYYASVGLTIFNLLDKPFISCGGGQITLDEALQQRQFGKIYIMVGINEMGTGTTQRFANTYRAALERIRELQPNALIFVQGILYVTAERSETDEYFTNDRIRDRNCALANLADGSSCFYLDVNDVLADEYGNLNQELSWDTCHLKAQYYPMWVDFLLSHGIKG